MTKPLLIDLFAGLGGWAEGGLMEGYYVVGFDIERHEYGEMKYPAQLVIQDVLTLHGKQFKDAALIVASPPCQAYSYRAMPWKLAKALPPPDNTLFETCFRIQREACEAAGRHIPLIVENVRGAQKWVGRARWNYGSFYLWGDVPALMPMVQSAQKFNPDGTARGPGSWFAIADSKNRGEKSTKNNGGSWFNIGSPGQKETGKNPVHELAGVKGIPHRPTGHWTNPDENGTKRPGVKLSEVGFNVSMARDIAAHLKGAKYERTADDKRQHIGINRKAASAMIAKIPFPLAQHIAQAWKPKK